jgi:hypothetical protein
MTDQAPALDPLPAATVRLPAEHSAPAASKPGSEFSDTTVVAGPKPELHGAAKRPLAVPLLASLGLHAAVLFLLADLSDELPDRPRILEPPPIVAEIVIDVPLHDAIPVAEAAAINSLQEAPLQLVDAAVSDLAPVASLPPVDPGDQAAPSLAPPDLPAVAEPVGAPQAIAHLESTPVETPASIESAVEEPAPLLQTAGSQTIDTAEPVNSRPIELNRATPVALSPGTIATVEAAPTADGQSSAAPAVAAVETSPAIGVAQPPDVVSSSETASVKPIEATLLPAQPSDQSAILAAHVPELNATAPAPVLAPSITAESLVPATAPPQVNPATAPEAALAVAAVMPVAPTASRLEPMSVNALDPIESKPPQSPVIPMLKPSEPSAMLQGEERREMAALVPPRLDRPVVDPRIALAQAVTGLDCARLRTGWEASEGKVSISGHLRSGEDRDHLVAALSGLDGVKQVVKTDLYIVGEPYCRVLAFLDQPGLTKSFDQRQGLEELGAPAQSGVVRFKGGMALELQLAGPDFAAYVYVDYFTADGQVYHLLPTRNLADHHVQPNEAFTVGGRSGRGLKATIGPPFGLDMVVAVASAQRLFSVARPTAENAREYLSALNAAVAVARKQDPSARLEYAYYLVQTSAN